MRRGGSTLGALVETIGRASAHPDDWRGVAEAIAGWCGAFGVALIPYTLERRPAVILSTRSMAPILEAYIGGGWYKQDLRAIGGVLAMRRKGWATDADIVDLKTIHTIPFYRDFMFRLGTRAWLGILYHVRGEEWCAAVVFPPPDLLPPAFTIDAVSAIAAALTARANATLDEVERHWQGVFSSFDAFGRGVALLGPGGDILAANESGERLLARLAGLKRWPPAAPANPLRLSPGGGAPVFRLLNAGDGGRIGVEIAAVPARLRHFALAYVRTAFLFEAQAESGEAAAEAARRWGLLSSEARILAALVDGQTLKQAAQTHGISEGTARQQLKAVFRKSGAKSQAALMRDVLGGG